MKAANTITIGASGDTVVFASDLASQSGLVDTSNC